MKESRNLYPVILRRTIMRKMLITIQYIFFTGVTLGHFH